MDRGWGVVVVKVVIVVKGVVEVLIWVAVDVVGGEREVVGDAADGVRVERVEVSDERGCEEAAVVSEPVVVEAAGLDELMLW